MKLTITLEIKGTSTTLSLAEAEDLYIQLASLFRPSPRHDFPCTLPPVTCEQLQPKDWGFPHPTICGTGSPVPKTTTTVS